MKDTFKEDTNFFKSFESADDRVVMLKSKALPIGMVKEWKGKKYKKVGPGHWKPIKEGTEAQPTVEKKKIKVNTNEDVKDAQNKIKKLHEEAKKLAIGNPKRSELTSEMRSLAYAINYKTTKEGNRGNLTPIKNITVDNALDVANKSLGIKDAESKEKTDMRLSDVNKLKVSDLEKITGLKANPHVTLPQQREDIINRGVKNKTINKYRKNDPKLREFNTFISFNKE